MIWQDAWSNLRRANSLGEKRVQDFKKKIELIFIDQYEFRQFVLMFKIMDHLCEDLSEYCNTAFIDVAP